MITGMITIRVNDTQMLLCNAVQVVLAAVLQPAWVWLEIRDCTTMMPTRIVTIKLMRMTTMPPPILLLIFSPLLLLLTELYKCENYIKDIGV